MTYNFVKVTLQTTLVIVVIALSVPVGLVLFDMVNMAHDDLTSSIDDDTETVTNDNNLDNKSVNINNNNVVNNFINSNGEVTEEQSSSTSVDDFDKSIKEAADQEAKEQAEIDAFNKSIEEAAELERQQEKKEHKALFIKELKSNWNELISRVTPMVNSMVDAICVAVIFITSCMFCNKLFEYVTSIKNIDDIYVRGEEPDISTVTKLRDNYKYMKWLWALVLILLLCVAV